MVIMNSKEPNHRYKKLLLASIVLTLAIGLMPSQLPAQTEDVNIGQIQQLTERINCYPNIDLPELSDYQKVLDRVNAMYPTACLGLNPPEVRAVFGYPPLENLSTIELVRELGSLEEFEQVMLQDAQRAEQLNLLAALEHEQFLESMGDRPYHRVYLSTPEQYFDEENRMIIITCNNEEEGIYFQATFGGSKSPDKTLDN
ncbi:MAG: hypothetical protein LBU61_01270 [Coriobacteriales bacterium]|jgi:hypothetical protein|nr:hypothetical protein [Coriobacteriales bacterium]